MKRQLGLGDDGKAEMQQPVEEEDNAVEDDDDEATTRWVSRTYVTARVLDYEWKIMDFLDNIDLKLWIGSYALWPPQASRPYHA